MRSPSRTTNQVTLNMTPMIDVVFLLIIFFLVSSHLARQETQLELDLPTAGAADNPVGEADQQRVTINVLPDGRVLLGAEPADGASLAQRLAVEQQQAGGELRVRVRGDRAAPYASIEPVLVACAKAGVWDVAFAVTERRSLP